MSDPAEESQIPQGVAPRKRVGPIRLADDNGGDGGIPILLRLPLVSEPSATGRTRSRSRPEAEPLPTTSDAAGSRARRRGSEPPPLQNGFQPWWKIGGVILASVLVFGGAYHYFTRGSKTPTSPDPASVVETTPDIPVITPPEPAPLKKHEAAPLAPRIADARPATGGAKPAAPAPNPNPPHPSPAPEKKPNPNPAPQATPAPQPGPQGNPNPAPQNPAPQNPAPQNPPRANPQPAPNLNPTLAAPAPNPNPPTAPKPDLVPPAVNPAPPAANPGPPLSAAPAPSPPPPLSVTLPQNNPGLPNLAPPANSYPSTGAPAPALPTVIDRTPNVNVPSPLIVPNPTFRADHTPNHPGIRTANAAPIAGAPTYPSTNYPTTDPNTYWFRPDRPAFNPGPAPGGNPAGTAELGPMIDSPPIRSR